ncbi:MAG: hypothetical protein ACI4T9_12485, partial [Prevotella sp.]
LKIAQDEGIITPFYTATGWGNAAVIGNKAIPVTSAYPYATWTKPVMSPFTVNVKGGKPIKVTTLTRQQAIDACKVNGRLLITKATVLPDGDDVQLLSLGDNTVSYVVYPSQKGFKTQTATVKAVKPVFNWNKRSPRRMSVHFNDSIVAPQVQEYFLNIDYVGDVAMAFMDGQLCQFLIDVKLMEAPRSDRVHSSRDRNGRMLS